MSTSSSRLDHENHFILVMRPPTPPYTTPHGQRLGAEDGLCDEHGWLQLLHCRVAEPCLLCIFMLCYEQSGPLPCHAASHALPRVPRYFFFPHYFNCHHDVQTANTQHLGRVPPPSTVRTPPQSLQKGTKHLGARKSCDCGDHQRPCPKGE